MENARTSIAKAENRLKFVIVNMKLPLRNECLDDTHKLRPLLCVIPSCMPGAQSSHDLRKPTYRQKP